MFPNVFRRIALAQGLLPEASPRDPDRKPRPPATDGGETRDAIEPPSGRADKDWAYRRAGANDLPRGDRGLYTGDREGNSH